MSQFFVSNKNESPPMFKNKFVDFFSRLHWSVPLFIFVPMILAALYRSFFQVNLEIWMVFLLMTGGLMIWSLLEYVLHRFIFHWIPKFSWGKRFHFIVHGVHHDFPNDQLRLVMPVAVSVPLAIIFYGVIYLFAGPVFTAPIFTGLLIGYLFYDMLHFSVHHVKSNNKWFKTIQKHHMRHHFSSPNHGYGFTSKIWDRLFGTIDKS